MGVYSELGSTMPDYQGTVNEFVDKLEKRKVEGSQAARLTAELLRLVISQQRLPPTNLAVALIEVVKSVGEKLIAANSVELAIGNIVRRVLHSIREEDLLIDDVSTGSDDGDIQQDYRPVSSPAARNLLRPPSLHTLLESVPISAAACHTTGEDSDLKGKSDKYSRSRKLKNNIVEAVDELISEIDFCHERIAEQAVEHIHQNEVILTFGRSRAVLEFLCGAKVKERLFRVLIAEGGPRYHGHVLAKELAGNGLETTLITDSAVFAVISGVNLVVVGVHAVLANGGVIGPVGLNIVALAARKYSVPFVVVAGIHKLCPLYPHSPAVPLTDMKSPSDILEYGKFSDCMNFESGMGAPLLRVINPAFDYVPPELVSLQITDT